VIANPRLKGADCKSSPAVANFLHIPMSGITVDDIRYIEACGDYVSIHCTDKKLTVHGTLKSWEDRLKGSTF
jgi:DNA-binding LytR/AlgR family response regulator